MAFLPKSAAIVVTGGRNDDLCSEGQQITPFLNDLHLFLLDQKVWIGVKYSQNSSRLDHVCNSSIAVVSDGPYMEKIMIFGGI